MFPAIFLSQQIGVYKDFRDLAVSTCYTPDLPVSATCQSGLFVYSNLLPATFSGDKEVQFDVFTSNNGISKLFTLNSVTSNAIITG